VEAAEAVVALAPLDDDVDDDVTVDVRLSLCSIVVVSEGKTGIYLCYNILCQLKHYINFVLEG